MYTCFSPKISHSFLLQSEKKEILRRLNQNLKESPVAEAKVLMPTPGGPCATGPERHTEAGEQLSPSRDRKKWEAAELFALPVAQQTLEETCSTINGKCIFSIQKAEIEAPMLVPLLE